MCSITQTTPTPSYQSIFYDQEISDGDEQTLQQTYSSKRSASCVQSFDDSLDSAIRMTYRISLRSSSLWEPRHPLLKVMITLKYSTSDTHPHSASEQERGSSVLLLKFVIRFNFLNHFRWLQKDSNGLNTAGHGFLL